MTYVNIKLSRND